MSQYSLSRGINDEGEVTFGGTNPERYIGPIHYYPLVENRRKCVIKNKLQAFCVLVLVS